MIGCITNVGSVHSGGDNATIVVQDVRAKAKTTTVFCRRLFLDTGKSHLKGSLYGQLYGYWFPTRTGNMLGDGLASRISPERQSTAIHDCCILQDMQLSSQYLLLHSTARKLPGDAQGTRISWLDSKRPWRKLSSSNILCTSTRQRSASKVKPAPAPVGR